MKTKPLLLAAVIATSLALPAMAADLEVYGRANLSIDALGDGEDTGLNVSSNASRLGFRAVTDIEGGMQVFVQLEQNVRFDQRGGDFATRNSFAGVRGDWGQLRVGSFDTPGKLVRSRVDVFNDRLADVRNIASGNDMSFDPRFRNGIHYRAPSFNNLTFDLHYSPHNDVDATTTNDREAISTSITYNHNGVYLGVAYESYETEIDNRELQPTAVRLGASFPVSDNFTLLGFYQHASDIPGGDRHVYGVGSKYRLSDNYSLMGQVYQSSDNDSPDTGATMFSLGLDRYVSDALTVYVIAGVTTNEDQADFSVSSSGRDTRLVPVVGKNSTGLSVGIVHKF